MAATCEKYLYCVLMSISCITHGGCAVVGKNLRNMCVICIKIWFFSWVNFFCDHLLKFVLSFRYHIEDDPRFSEMKPGAIGYEYFCYYVHRHLFLS